MQTTGLATEDARFDSYRGQEIFRYFARFIGALALTRDLIGWVQVTLAARRVKASGRYTDQSPS
jgi:hypothetical protein